MRAVNGGTVGEARAVVGLTRPTWTARTRVRAGRLAALIAAAAALLPIAAPAAQLVGSISTPGPTADLTALGTSDWVHWGLGSATAVDRKAGTTPQVSDFTPIGSRTPGNFEAPARVAYSWTDGSPTASANTTSGLYVGGNGNGFQLTVPADTTVRTLDVYVGGNKSRGRIEAFLSDASAPAYSASIENLGGVYDRRVTLSFQAAGAGRTLTFRYTRDGSTGNVTLQAATLVGGGSSGGGGNGALAGSVAAPAGTTSLTAQGTEDWAHWGLGSASGFNRRAGVTPRISDYTRIGAKVPKQFDSGVRLRYAWTNGTPTDSADTGAGLWVGGTGNGFQVSVPADTTTRTLNLYVGGYQSRGRLQAFLSDASAPSFETTLEDLGGVYDRAVALTYHAAGTGQLLTVRYTLDAGSNVTLQAATLQGGGTSTNQPPVLAPIGDRSVTIGSSLSFAVSATDTDGPAPLTLAAAGLPAGASFTDNGGGSGSFDWSPGAGADAGSPYNVTFTASDGAAATDAETIQITVSPSGGGQGAVLSGGVSTPTGTVSLSSIGSADWVHWGLSSATSVNRKSGVAPQIGNFTMIGGGSAGRFDAPARLGYSWTGGTPTASATTHAGVWVGGGSNGFQVTVPADTQTRTLDVFVGGNRTRGRFEATLSDGSAPPFVTTMENFSGVFDRRVTLSFRAAGAGRTLAVRYTRNASSGNVTLQGATLAGGSGGSGITLPFADDFGDGNFDGWAIVNETPTAGSWSVAGGELRQTTQIESVQSFEESYHLGSYAWLTGGTGLADYRVSARLRRVGTGRPESLGLLFRYTGPDSYYRVTLNPRYGFARLERRQNGLFFTLAASAIGYDPAAPFVLEVDALGSDLRVSLDGVPLLAARDAVHASGSVGLFSQASSGFDDVSIVAASTAASVRIARPVPLAVLPGGSLSVEAVARGVPAGGVVEFAVTGRQPVEDSTPPYTASFASLPAGERTVTARLLASGGTVLATDAVDIAMGGDYMLALGDSITNGIGDLFEPDNDDAQRIFATQAYASGLAAHLEALPPNEVIVFNEGIGGDSADRTDLQRLESLLERHPEATHALVQLGTNEALRNPPRPSGIACAPGDAGCLSGTFRGDMQSIVNRLDAEGVEVWLATAPPTLMDADPLNSPVNDQIAEYNEVVRTQIAGASAGPDLWALFGPDEDGDALPDRVRRDLYSDLLHPTGLGHALMAALWYNSLAGDASGTALDPFFLDEISRPAHRQNLLGPGDRYLVDSGATLSAVPAALSEAVWLMPRQADAGLSGANFLSFVIDRAATVYVAYDADATSLPTWLAGFAATGQTVTTSATTYQLYSQAFAAGTVTLGGNAASGAAGAADMYLVAVVAP